MSDNLTTAPAGLARRAFVAAVAGGAAAAMVAPVASLASGDPDPVHPDAILLELEEKIFEQHELATAYDDEIMRLAKIWNAESHRLYQEALAAETRRGIYLSPQERWNLVTDIPECIEHNRLCNLQEPFTVKMDALIKQMFATPAHTAEGRRAKVLVLLGCIMGDDWRHVDERTEYREFMARSLLIEFIGGEPGEQMRDQFA
jgi:hypothetical protein